MQAWSAAACLALTVSIVGASDDLPEPWLDHPPFEVPPAILLSSAYAHPFPAGAGALVLLHETMTELDEQHRSVNRTRQIYRLLTPDGVRDWSNVSVQYSPWYQERPTVRARVITSDAAVHELDPDTLAESPFGTEVPNVYSDQRLLAGPLPAVSVGSVVEIEIEERDKQPLFDAGVARWVPLQYPFSTRRLRVSIETPKALPFRHEIRGRTDVEATTEEKDDRTRISLELGPLEPLEIQEPFTPYDEAGGPYLSWSTGDSWAAVARRYSAIVEERLQDFDAGKMVRKTLRKAETPLEQITAIVSRLHENVRYTGLQFGEAGIVPASPRLTLERKFGDCKDTATLLVAMLRSAGFEAHVALVDSGIEPDLDVEMPGLGIFDHAVVHVADPELWIDSTVPTARPGILTMGVEGRIALIASPETTSTTRIPEMTSQDNRNVETREIFLEERGGARVIETNEAWGLWEIHYRDWYASTEVEDQEESLQSYASEFFGSDEQIVFEASDPADLHGPYRFTLEIENAATAFSGPEQAVVSIPTVAMASRLVEYLPLPDEVSEETSDLGRRSDYNVPWPYVLEWDYRVHPAPGFEAAPLPPDDAIGLGPVTLERRFSLEDDGSINVVLSFDTRKRRWTPAEFAQVWQGLEKLEQEGAIYLSFEQVGRRHLAAGRVREALGEFRRLAAMHPTEALHRSELAETLVAAGLGEAARVEARRAVDIEPEDDDAHRTLGWVLLYDPIGRFLERGCDPLAAESAFRKARESGRSDPDTRASLAFLLGLDLRLLPDGPPARLEEAIAEYRSIREDLDDHSYDLDLARALWQAEEFEELRRLIAELPPSLDRNLLWVAEVTATDGVDAGLARAWSLATVAEQRHELIQMAAQWLIGSRFYSQAAGLIAKGIPSDPSTPGLTNFVDLLSRVRRHETLKLDEQPGPAAFVKRTIVGMIGRQAGAPAFSEHFAKVYEQVPSETEGLEERLRATLRLMRSQMASTSAAALDVALDMILAATEWKVDGDAASGYRCRVRTVVPGMEQRWTYFVVVEDDEYRLLGIEPHFWMLGLEALRRLDSTDAPPVDRLLDWAYEARPTMRLDDPLDAPFFRLWNPDSPDERDPRAAAAALVAGSPGSQFAIPILEQGLETADDDERIWFDLALAMAHAQLENWESTFASARRLRTVHPGSERAFRLEAGALAKLQRWDELSEVANERLEGKKDDIAALQILASAASEQGRYGEAEALLRRIIDAGKGGPFEYNNVAWHRVQQGKVDAEAVVFAERAALNSRVPSAASLHTLATVYAEVGRSREAREYALRQMVARGAEQPDSLEWHVFGRIAEDYGELEAAVLYYSRVSPSEGEAGDCKPCYRIAQQRRRKLEAVMTSRKGSSSDLQAPRD
jgi:transglutaminase-like putative cysteine protease/tetratricopeptide (TPR) repeat protein